jgi:hypothetical protein
VAGGNYEIVIRGRLGRAISRWFDRVEVRASGPDETHLAEVGELGLELRGVRLLSETE